MEVAPSPVWIGTLMQAKINIDRRNYWRMPVTDWNFAQGSDNYDIIQLLDHKKDHT